MINPFDFFLENSAETVPFEYESWLSKELQPFLHVDPSGPQLSKLLQDVRLDGQPTVTFLVDLNQQLQHQIGYVIRMEPGVQSPEQTLTMGTGSCRDTAWLLIHILRHLGLAARFASGYLIQLAADQEPIEGPRGPAQDFTWLKTLTPSPSS